MGILLDGIKCFFGVNILYLYLSLFMYHSCLVRNNTQNHEMLQHIGPRIMKRLRSPKKFQNPYFDQMSYAESSTRSVHGNPGEDLPEWFFETTEQTMQRHANILQTEQEIIDHKKVIQRSGAIQKETIVDICRELVRILNRNRRQRQKDNFLSPADRERTI